MTLARSLTRGREYSIPSLGGTASLRQVAGHRPEALCRGTPEEVADARVRVQQPLDVASQVVVAVGGRGDPRLALGVRPLQGVREQVVEPAGAVGAQPTISAKRRVRRCSKARCTVRSETPSTSAASDAESPPK